MFENFEEFKNRKMPAWVIPVLVAAIGAHVIFVVGLVIKEMWAAPLLDVPSSGVDLAVAPPPPPPPPPPKGGKKLDTQKEKKPKKVKPTETVQPTKVEDKPAETTTEDSGDEGGEEGGEEGGVEGGVVGGVVGGVISEAPPPPPPPPPPAPPQNIAPTALEQQRVSGDKNIFPDDVTKTEIQRSGKTQLMVPVKVCIDRAGQIASVKIMKSSGFPAYDQKLTREINKWRYRPFSVNGTATPVCSAIQFIYRQKG